MLSYVSLSFARESITKFAAENAVPKRMIETVKGYSRELFVSLNSVFRQCHPPALSRSQVHNRIGFGRQPYVPGVASNFLFISIPRNKRSVMRRKSVWTTSPVVQLPWRMCRSCNALFDHRRASTAKKLSNLLLSLSHQRFLATVASKPPTKAPKSPNTRILPTSIHAHSPSRNFNTVGTRSPMANPRMGRFRWKLSLGAGSEFFVVRDV